MREVIITAKAMLHERGRPPSEWTTVLPAVQWALNTAVRQRLGTPPYCVMLGREPRTAFSALVEEDNECMELTVVDEERLREHVRSIVSAHDELQKQVVERRDVQRQQTRTLSSRGELPHFTVGDYVLVARVRKEGKHAKLMATWTGQWQVASDDREHVYVVQHLITGEPREAHVARMRLFFDGQLHVTSQLREIFQQLEHLAEYHIEEMTTAKRAARGDEFVVFVKWMGLDEAEGTWEPVSRVMTDAPAILRRSSRN